MTLEGRANDFMARGILCGAFANKEALPDIREAFISAITAAVEEDRRARPHTFVGRTDRGCDLCGEPDRYEIHIANREMLRNRLKLAVEEEREAIRRIACNMMRRYDVFDDPRAAVIIELTEAIRARSTADTHSTAPAEK